MKVTLAQLKSRNGDIEGNLARIIETTRQHSDSDLIVFPPRFLTGMKMGMYSWGDNRKLRAKAENLLRSSVPLGQTLIIGTGENNSDGYYIYNDKQGMVHYGAQVAQWENLVIVFNASPYTESYWEKTPRPLGLGTTVIMRPVGGVDNFVYPGASTLWNNKGVTVCEMPRFEENFYTFDTENVPAMSEVTVENNIVADQYKAIVLGIRDYFTSTGLKKITLGASGGIDSALVLTMAADAIGGENVIGISMPSKHSSQHSVDDARELMNNLGGEFRLIPINVFHDNLNSALHLINIADENLQARIRGLIVMGVANQESCLVLEPGNKSESAMGYSTIYGDTVGGYAPICDILKTRVYEMARWRNKQTTFATQAPIPVSSIEKQPSAELKPNQLDTDSLPPYDILDPIIEALTVCTDPAELYEEYGKEMVDDVFRQMVGAEWKRRQTAFGANIADHPLNFRDVPVTITYNPLQ